jgi:poly-gamma-glutamate synthesis protein (capsule biosynthesis protein)
VAPPLPESTGDVPVLPARWDGPAELSRVHIVAVGDLLMHTNVKNSAKAANALDADGNTTNHSGFPDLFEHVAPWISDADLAFANLETPVAPKSNNGTASMVFNVHPDLLPALSASGFDVLSFANNHVYDQGRDGLVETMELLDASGMTWIGSGDTCADARAYRLTQVNDITIAWIGASKVHNSNLNLTDDDPCTFVLDVEQTLTEAQAARDAGADLVIASVHWGREYRLAPEAVEVADAQALMDGGVDLVLGHHPHVVQPVEIRHTPDGRVAVTAYSLGNFISNQRYDYVHGVHPLDHGNPRDGLALELDVVRKDYGPGPDGERQIRVELANVQAVPLWTDSDAMRIVHPSPTIRVVRMHTELDAAYAALDAAQTPEDALAAKQRIELLEDRWDQVEAVVGEGLLPAR